ncbi:hypothetical protein VP01_2828g3 [Puccinia sorghi]|uniref:Uncharacterized protein n=1 Tax=Puccinia sorghi TaxID=27349 RepID=A0A0L6V2A3_9BASI|nr:hypothetical protein VP01_2828g3 [Puccinia sorghi]
MLIWEASEAGGREEEDKLKRKENEFQFKLTRIVFSQHLRLFFHSCSLMIRVVKKRKKEKRNKRTSETKREGKGTGPLPPGGVGYQPQQTVNHHHNHNQSTIKITTSIKIMVKWAGTGIDRNTNSQIIYMHSKKLNQTQPTVQPSSISTRFKSTQQPQHDQLMKYSATDLEVMNGKWKLQMSINSNSQKKKKKKKKKKKLLLINSNHSDQFSSQIGSRLHSISTSIIISIKKPHLTPINNLGSQPEAYIWCTYYHKDRSKEKPGVHPFIIIIKHINTLHSSTHSSSLIQIGSPSTLSLTQIQNTSYVPQLNNQNTLDLKNTSDRDGRDQSNIESSGRPHTNQFLQQETATCTLEYPCEPVPEWCGAYIGEAVAAGRSQQ